MSIRNTWSNLRPTATLISRCRHRSLSPAILLGLSLGMMSLGAVTTGKAEQPADTGDLPFTDPFTFVDGYTDSPDVKALGFPAGPKPVLLVGMIVKKGDAEKAGTPVDIVSATATNGNVTIDLVYADVGVFELWENTGDNKPLFDPESHIGTWIITATDSTGATATTQPVVLEYGIEMPLVEGVKAEAMASGDLAVTWSVPELDPEIEEKCDIEYRLRLLENYDKQVYRSGAIAETSVNVPADILKEKAGGNLDGLWGRIEMYCRDKQEKDDQGVGELEARSNTFFPLN